MLKKTLILSLLAWSFALIFAISDAEARHCRKNHRRQNCSRGYSNSGNCGYTHNCHAECGSGQWSSPQAGYAYSHAPNASTAHAGCCHQPGSATAENSAATTAPTLISANASGVR